MPNSRRARTMPSLTNLAVMAALIVGCSSPAPTPDVADPGSSGDVDEERSAMDVYASFRLEADLSGLSDAEKAMIPLLIEAAQAMDGVF